MKQLFTLNRFIIQYKWHFLLGILFVSLSNYFGILIPQEIRKALDYTQTEIVNFKLLPLNSRENFRDNLGYTLFIFGVTITGFVILKGLFMFLMRQTLIVMSRKIEYEIRKELFDHISSLDQYFFREKSTGDIMSRMTEDVSKVREYLGPGLLYAINLITLFFFTISAMLSVDVTLTIYALLPLPVLSISIYYVSSLINKKSTKIQQQLSKLTGNAQETYSGIRIIKSYVQEHNFLEKFIAQNTEYKARTLSLARVESYFQPLMAFLIAISTILVVVIGGFRVYAGYLTPGNIAEFILYVNMLTWPVTAIGWIASIIQEAEASQFRINEFLNTKSKIVNTNPKEYEISGSIKFENVSFTYKNTGVAALNNFSLTISAGQKIALLGKTGSGKTTIVDLLARTFDVDSGRILIDDLDIRHHNLHVLRNKIAYVPQDVFLFSDSVANNIAFGSNMTTVTRDEIEYMAKKASVYEEIIKLPNGFDTIIGERGVTLSGGQKQRISIARALIRYPEIFIFDDSLSAVDTNTEQEIFNYLNQVTKGKTMITITHRINNLQEYDLIVVIDQGKIIEIGDHNTLINLNGYYALTYNQQALRHSI